MPSAYPPETETRDDRQVERRLERALSADFEIQNLGPDPVFSVFAVKSPSGRTYEVTIRHLTERANRCSCPDFRTNLIGTCKHIEAVLVRTHRPAEYRDRLSPVPAHPQIYLHYGDDLTVRVIRPMNIDPVVADLLDRYFDCDDLFRGDPARDLGSLLETAPAAGHVDISSDVYEQLRHLREAARWNAERHRYLERLEAGEPLRVGRFELRGYQNRGVVHLATTRLAVLADENGLGKSVQAIGAVELLRRDHGIKTALVICPTSLKRHWLREIRRFAGVDAVVIDGPPEQRKARYALQSSYTIVGFEHIHRDIDSILRLSPEVTILDEAERIHNWRTRTAGAVRQIQSPFRWTLVGTTLEDRLDDLYAVMQFIDQRLLGPLWMYNRRYFIYDGKRVLGYKNLDQLKTRLSRVVLRRTWKEIRPNLPPIIDATYSVELTHEQEQGYLSATAELLSSITRMAGQPPRKSDLIHLVKILRRIQAACLAPQFITESTLDPSPKLEEAIELLSILLKENRRIVLTTAWDKFGKMCSQAFDSYNIYHYILDSKSAPARCHAAQGRFNDESPPPVLIVTDGVKTPMDLQAADTMIHLDVPYTTTQYSRRLNRARSAGNASSLRNIAILAANTLEESVLDQLQSGESLFEGSPLVCGRDGVQLPVVTDKNWMDLSAILKTPTAQAKPNSGVQFDVRTSGGRSDGPLDGEPTGHGSESVTSSPPDSAIALNSLRPPVAAGPSPADTPWEANSPGGSPMNRQIFRRAQTKLRAAECLLEGRLPDEAVGSAYEAMSLAVNLLLGEPSEGKETLSRLYAGPVKEGTVTPNLMAGFSRARDLYELVRGGSEDLVDVTIARAVVCDAETFINLITRGRTSR